MEDQVVTNLPRLDVDELAILFGYANKRGVNRAIRLEKFPIPTFTMNGRYYALVAHVNEYFSAQKKKLDIDFGWMDED